MKLNYFQKLKKKLYYQFIGKKEWNAETEKNTHYIMMMKNYNDDEKILRTDSNSQVKCDLPKNYDKSEF